jgi:hypothetical protein
MSKLSLNFYCDPGHGWAKVSIKTLVKLGIADKISRYSYQRGLYAYLEEDCDLNMLFAAADKAGIKITLKEYHTNKQSKIRSYCSYQYKAASTADFMQFLKDTGKLELITIGG